MLHLIKKDVTIHKILWLMYFAMTLFFVLMNNDPIFIIGLMSAIIIMNSFYVDERANAHKLWNALPFSRSEIVGARYVSSLLVTGIMMFTVAVMKSISSGGIESSLWKQVVGGFVLIVLIGALTYPIFFRWTQKGFIFIMIVLFVLLVIGGSHLFYYSYLYLVDSFIIPQKVSDSFFFSMSVLLALCLYMISWKLSIYCYRKQEFV